jgi:hypothetical protein
LNRKLRKEALAFLKDQITSPSNGESAAIAIGKEKTAALIYDRIWSPFDTIVPKKIRFSGATILEQLALVDILEVANGDWLKAQENSASYAGCLLNVSVSEMAEIHVIPASESSNDNDQQAAPSISLEMRPFIRGLAEEYMKLSIPVVPIYPSQSARDREYRAGKYEVIVSILSNLQMPDESSLSWEQVLEFRNDVESEGRLTKLLHWLNKDMVGRPSSLIEDEINMQLEDYQKALKKHGIKACLGMAMGTFATFFGTGFLESPLLEGILVGGVVTAYLVKSCIDKPSPPTEVAWVYELKQRLGKR